jgi:DNA-binding response OmpR family regulator
MAIKLMVVDDEAEVVQMFKAMVETLGYDAHTFVDSQEAARILAAERYDGIFLDARMPPPDGFELTRIARSSRLNSAVPVVMITGLDDVETMRAGFRAGITLFLGKPFNLERLRRLLNAIRGAMLREKWSHARLPFRTLVNCFSGGRHFRAASLNISETGILIDASGGLEVGAEIETEFVLPDHAEARKLKGRIVRKEPPDRVGIEFIDITPDSQEAIRRYIYG